jgi:hypothetical protein
MHGGGKPMRARTSEGAKENRTAVVEQRQSTGDSEDEQRCADLICHWRAGGYPFDTSMLRG